MIKTFYYIVHNLIFGLFSPCFVFCFVSLAFAAPNPYIIAGATPTAQDPYTLGIATVAGQDIQLFCFLFLLFLV